MMVQYRSFHVMDHFVWFIESSGDYGPIGDNSGMGNNYFLAPCHNSLTCSTVAIPGTLCQVVRDIFSSIEWQE